jgi:hypothetical protein
MAFVFYTMGIKQMIASGETPTMKLIGIEVRQMIFLVLLKQTDCNKMVFIFNLRV